MSNTAYVLQLRAKSNKFNMRKEKKSSFKLHLVNKYIPEKWPNNSSLPVVYV